MDCELTAAGESRADSGDTHWLLKRITLQLPALSWSRVEIPLAMLEQRPKAGGKESSGKAARASAGLSVSHLATAKHTSGDAGGEALIELQ